tara:strand:- start:1227 stop:1790 length:564 start_codon:yes stop_codon:yes gene_type:complete
MSRIKRPQKLVTSETSETVPIQLNYYEPQHPLYSFENTASEDTSDHLDSYTEVHPFQDTEPGFFGSTLGEIGGKIGRASKKAAESTYSMSKKAAKSTYAAGKRANNSRKQNNTTKAAAAAASKIHAKLHKADKSVEAEIAKALKGGITKEQLRAEIYDKLINGKGSNREADALLEAYDRFAQYIHKK